VAGEVEFVTAIPAGMTDSGGADSGSARRAVEDISTFFMGSGPIEEQRY
jgi:hypothetical protein